MSNVATLPVPRRAVSQETARPRETILLVEDEDAVRRIVCTILQRHGYEVLDASTPGRQLALAAHTEIGERCLRAMTLTGASREA